MDGTSQGSGGNGADAARRRWARRFWRPVVAVVAAFGMLGAIGGKIVDHYYDDVAEPSAATGRC